MMRLLLLLALIAFGCKWITGRWPWEYLKATSLRGQARSRARKLLALPPGATREEILDAHKRLVTVIHPDKGGSNAQVHEANAARDLLLEELPEK